MTVRSSRDSAIHIHAEKLEDSGRAGRNGPSVPYLAESGYADDRESVSPITMTTSTMAAKDPRLQKKLARCRVVNPSAVGVSGLLGVRAILLENSTGNAPVFRNLALLRVAENPGCVPTMTIGWTTVRSLLSC